MHIFPSAGRLKAVVQIIPGMAEHTGRYREFAFFLAENGYAVYCADHPGSGISAGKEKNLGVLPVFKGWEVMLESIRALYTHIRQTHIDLPVFIFGHSMGSVLARHFTAVYPVYIGGLILSGTFETPGIIIKFSRALVGLMIKIQGGKTKSKWFNRLFYKNLNRRFRRGPTTFEWISSVREEVDKYVEDPWCGYDCSWGFYKSLFRGITATKRAQHNLKYRKTLPILNFCGQDDPVGNFGRDALKIHHYYFRQRFQNHTFKVFRGRHELLHEENKEAVFFYLLDWLNNNLRP